VLEKTLKSPLDSKEIKPVNPKGNQSWIFTGRTDAEAEAVILWSPDVKSWLTGKDPNTGKLEGYRWRATVEEMIGWHHWLSGHEFEQTLWDGEGQESLACFSPRDHRVRHNLASEQQQSPLSEVLYVWTSWSYVPPPWKHLHFTAVILQLFVCFCKRCMSLNSGLQALWR